MKLGRRKAEQRPAKTPAEAAARAKAGLDPERREALAPTLAAAEQGDRLDAAEMAQLLRRLQPLSTPDRKRARDAFRPAVKVSDAEYPLPRRGNLAQPDELISIVGEP